MAQITFGEGLCVRLFISPRSPLTKAVFMSSFHRRHGFPVNGGRDVFTAQQRVHRWVMVDHGSVLDSVEMTELCIRIVTAQRYVRVCLMQRKEGGSE